MSTFSSLLMLNLEHVVSKWGMSYLGPAFMGGLSPVPYRLLVPDRHAQKWLNLWPRPNLWRPPEISLISVKPQQSLTLLIGALLKSRKNTTNHCCCPISAVILTTSELEAKLENQRLGSVLYARGRERGGGNGVRGENNKLIRKVIWFLSPPLSTPFPPPPPCAQGTETIPLDLQVSL